MTVLDRPATTPRRRRRPARRTDGDRTAAAVDLRVLSEDEVADLAEELAGWPVPGVRWTERQFVDWAFGRFDAEWVDGEVVLMSPVDDIHDTLEVWLTTLLQMFIE